VFAVEACAEVWAVTSYFPAPVRYTAFAGVPVRVRSAGGLWYEVVVLEEGPPRVQVVA
jgi:hypothetical protein